MSSKANSKANVRAVLGKMLGITIDPVSVMRQGQKARANRERLRVTGSINNLRYTTAIHSNKAGRHLKLVGESK